MWGMVELQEQIPSTTYKLRLFAFLARPQEPGRNIFERILIRLDA
jgi:hypothetical protein